ncbi:MAG: DsbA family protein [Patescibacteria group bacterium]|nr:DsbA family protein [Patescibacteria group bacterium]
MENNKKSSLGVPIAIIIAGLLIAGAVFYRGSTPAPGDQTPPVGSSDKAYQLDEIAPITASDNVRGNPNASIVFFDYSDLECPFCKMFHWSMEALMEEYGDRVAWVYRHYPLDCNGGETPGCRVLHTKARQEAEASECVAELGGESTFWTYIDKIFDATPSNDGLDLEQLPVYAGELGIEEADFNQCLTDRRHAQKVIDNTTNGTAIGLDGTPFVILSAPNDILTVALRGPAPAEADDLTKEVIEFLDAAQQESYLRLTGGNN